MRIRKHRQIQIKIIAYADDMQMKELFEIIVREGEEMGLKINIDRTKIMRSARQNDRQKVNLGTYEFEQVGKFEYLGAAVTNTGDKVEEARSYQKQQRQNLQKTYFILRS